MVGCVSKIRARVDSCVNVPNALRVPRVPNESTDAVRVRAKMVEYAHPLSKAHAINARVHVRSRAQIAKRPCCFADHLVVKVRIK
jgi:hypothetical protein